MHWRIFFFYKLRRQMLKWFCTRANASNFINFINSTINSVHSQIHTFCWGEYRGRSKILVLNATLNSICFRYFYSWRAVQHILPYLYNPTRIQKILLLWTMDSIMTSYVVIGNHWRHLVLSPVLRLSVFVFCKYLGE